MKRALLWILAILALALALCPELVASDLPLACRVDGNLYLFPSLTRPATLDPSDRTRATFWLGTPIPHSPTAQRSNGMTEVLSPPTSRHLLGTDDRGRDVAARLVHGTRVALVVGIGSMLVAALLGLLVGLGAALSRPADAILSRVIEVGLSFPTLFLLLVLQGLRGSTSLAEVTLAIALTQWPHLARLCRTEARRALAAPHVEAARAIGASPLRIAVFHLLPFTLSPLSVALAFGVAQAVLLESGLSLLGLGAPPPTPSWGELLQQAQAAGLPAWLLWPPTLAIGLVVLLANQLGRRLRPKGVSGWSL